MNSTNLLKKIKNKSNKSCIWCESHSSPRKYELKIVSPCKKFYDFHIIVLPSMVIWLCYMTLLDIETTLYLLTHFKTQCGQHKANLELKIIRTKFTLVLQLHKHLYNIATKVAPKLTVILLILISNGKNYKQRKECLLESLVPTSCG